MDARKIVKQKQVDTSEMMYVVEQYIKERKGVNVKIGFRAGFDGIEDAQLLNIAYQSAYNYFLAN